LFIAAKWRSRIRDHSSINCNHSRVNGLADPPLAWVGPAEVANVRIRELEAKLANAECERDATWQAKVTSAMQPSDTNIQSRLTTAEQTRDAKHARIVELEWELKSARAEAADHKAEADAAIALQHAFKSGASAQVDALVSEILALHRQLGKVKP